MLSSLNIGKLLKFINLFTFVVLLSISLVIGYMGSSSYVTNTLLKYWSYFRNTGFVILFLLLVLSLLELVSSKEKKVTIKTILNVLIGIIFLAFSYPLGATLGTMLNIIYEVVLAGNYFTGVLMIILLIVYIFIPFLLYKLYKYIRLKL